MTSFTLWRRRLVFGSALGALVAGGGLTGCGVGSRALWAVLPVAGAGTVDEQYRHSHHQSHAKPPPHQGLDITAVLQHECGFFRIRAVHQSVIELLGALLPLILRHVEVD